MLPGLTQPTARSERISRIGQLLFAGVLLAAEAKAAPAVHASKPRLQKRRSFELVRAAFQRKGRWTPKELRSALQLTSHQIKAVLQQAVNEGWLARTGRTASTVYTVAVTQAMSSGRRDAA